MIELQNVSYMANDKIILDNVSLEIKEGETFVILGPSGAGKSSILKIICGLWKPDSGNILIHGTKFNDLKRRRKQKEQRRFGMVFQGNALFDSLTVAENIGYFLTEQNQATAREIDTTINELLSFVNLKGSANLQIDQLSGGMKKRVAIARALAFNPDILLFDEPTTGLDPINTKNILRLITKIHNSGKTSVVVTHILNDAFVISDSFAIINDGRVVEKGTKNDLQNSQDVFIQEFIRDFGKAGIMR